MPEKPNNKREMGMRKQMMGLLMACSTAALTAASSAGDKEDMIIDKVVAAYGGEALTGMESIRIDTRSKILTVGQSATPEMIGVARGGTRLTVDYENNRKAVKNWNKGRGGFGYTHTIHDGEKATAYNHITKSVTENPNANIAAFGGGTMRVTDTTLAKMLSEARADAVAGDDAMYRGKAHSTVTFKMEASPDLTVFVDKDTGLISKMTRENPQLGTLSYIFSEYKRDGMVSYASNVDFYIAGQPNIISTAKTVEVNPSIDGDFEGTSGYVNGGSQTDTSEMLVRKIADGVYYAGQNGGFSIFVDAGDHYVASGGYPQLPARLEAVQKEAGNEKPLKQIVVTHHHSDHLGGMDEAAKLGAEFVTVASHVAPVRATIEGDVADDRFRLVDGRTELAGGKMQVIDIATAHSAQYLLVYIPSAKLVFSADHFSTNLESGLPAANNNMATFRTAVEALNLDIDGFLGAHGQRQLTMDDLRTATNGYMEGKCPAGDSFCAD
jgi:glyoxylase-like metal-dependent hydrolase (beta-lactamase superfamily II)